MKIKTLFSAAVLHTAFLFPQTSAWNAGGSGSWFVAGNWNNNVPNSVGAVSEFLASIIAPSTVTLDTASATVGTMLFINTANAYTIAATSPNTLTLQGSGGTAAITIGAATDSAHVISAPMILMNPLTITQNSTTNAFTISGVMSGSSSVTTAGAGAIALTGLNSYTGGTTVTAGTLDCNATTTLPPSGALTITGGTVVCNAVNALPSTGTTTLSGGTLNLNNLSQSAGPIAGTTNITLGSATLTSTTSITTSYSGTISGTGGFALAGSGGVLTFSTAQTYTGGTTISGSTLQLGISNGLAPGGNLTVNAPGVFNLATFNQTVAVLSGSGSIVTPGNLISNTPTNSIFSGSISGTGSFTLMGVSTLEFTGVNSYTGGTNITGGGTLQLGINNALAPTGPVSITSGTLDMTPAASTAQAIGPLSGSGNVLLGATQLTINSTSSSSFSGAITGSGSLIVAGPQTFTLTGTLNTYTGGTTVTGGTLALGANGALPAGGNLTINSPGTFNLATFSQTIGVLSGNGSIIGSGTLTVDTPGGMTSNFSGVMSQGGALVVGGTGTLILTGANTYTGGTTVMGAATLQGNTTSLQGTITNSGTLIFNQISSGTFTGTLLGTGSLILNGGGNLTLNGTQTEGSASITAGELILGTASNLVASTVTIAAGASLETTGIGKITGAVTVNGTTELALNTIHITGSYTQAAGSTLVVDVTPSANGFLPVTGAVTLSGLPTIDIDVEKGIYAPSTVYTLITAGSPVVGTFAAPVFDNPFFDGTLVYNSSAPGSVVLILNIAPFGTVIKGGNAGAIAECINLLAFPSESDLLPILETLIFFPVEEVRDILELMQPSQLKALGLTEENNLVVIRTSISQHLDHLYKTECNQAASELYEWNVWSNFSGDFLRQEGQRDNIAYSADTAAATVGIDAALAKNFFVGVAGGYDYSWIDWSHSRGHGSISSLYAGPYFAWFNHRIFTNVSLVGTWNDYHASRHISFPTVDRHANSEHNGQGLIAHFDMGVMMYPAAEMTFSPIAGIDYIHLGEQGYTEHDAGSLDLKIHPTHASLWRTELGLQIAKCAILVHNKWTHDLKLSWIHQYALKGKHLHAQFKGVDCTFTVKGVQPNQDYFDVATGLTGVFMKDKLSAAVRYEGKFGDGICDNTGYVQLTYRF